jgi:hypothetical protein
MTTTITMISTQQVEVNMTARELWESINLNAGNMYYLPADTVVGDIAGKYNIIINVNHIASIAEEV